MATIVGLHYELHGPIGAPPLLLSPGIDGLGRGWSGVVSALAACHRVIVYDHRGMGMSLPASSDAPTVAAMADDIAALLDALAVPQIDIVGHSAGGTAALALAIKAPERIGRLALINAWATPDRRFGRVADTWAALLADAGVRAFVAAEPLFLYPADWDVDHGARLDGEQDARVAGFPAVETMIDRLAALRAFDVGLALGEVATPVLTIAAADDVVVPAGAGARLAARLPNGRSVRLPHGGHACHQTEPAAIADLLLDFLRADQSSTG